MMRGEGLRTIAREVAALRREGRRLCQSLEEEENVLEVMVEQMARERTYRAGSSKEIGMCWGLSRCHAVRFVISISSADSWLREPRLIRKNGAWVRLPSRGLRVIELDFRPLSGLLTAFQFLPVKIGESTTLYISVDSSASHESPQFRSGTVLTTREGHAQHPQSGC